MRRLQLIEFHEQRWFPPAIRDEITDALRFGLNLLNAYGPVTSLLQAALRVTGNGTIVDLCSGGGGPWFGLVPKLLGDPAGLQIWLTDQYPNPRATLNVQKACEDCITAYPDSVDAMRVPDELKGFRTMFTAFHHFSPPDAIAILQNAVDANEGIGIFEITRRTPFTIALIFPWVFMLICCTPWIRPFRWSRLLWTYLIPIIPLVLLFDGVVSCLRAYRPGELREMADKLTGDEYQWDIGELSAGATPVTFLVGYPRTL